MQTITLDEARERFGEILHPATQTHREFDDPEGGIWRPVYVGRDLIGYRLYKLNKVGRQPRWPKRR